MHERRSTPRTSDPPLTMWARRALTIPGYLTLFFVALVSLPLLLPLAALVDGIRRARWVLVRTILFLCFYLACEAAGIVTSTLIWLLSGTWLGADPDRFIDRNYRLQWLWGTVLARGAFALFSIDVDAEGLRLPRDRPILLMLRHASVADTILAVLLVSAPHRVRLRYVLKRELLWDPCLDIVGNRLPNYFVRRGASDGAAEVSAVGRLAEALIPGEGVLIYPEGTRFTPRKRERALERLAASASPEVLERARTLQRVLPPRLGGPLELLERAGRADVVFCAHTGLEGSTSFAELWNGGLVGSTVKVRFWTIPAERVPAGREARSAWLYENWHEVDDFVAAARPSTV